MRSDGGFVQAAASRRAVTLTVFMEGTSNPMSRVTTQIAFFSRICSAEPLDADLQEHDVDAAKPATERPGHYKLSFHGCGVSHGLRGVIFAHGLREQCATTRTYVEAFIANGHSVLLNFVGLSRGGIGGLYLAQTLADIDKAHVILNLLLFDPVPGNFLWMSRYVDLFRFTNANQAMDISQVGNLGRVVTLYPHEALPDIAVHAPLLVKYPPDCDVEEDVILGCHQGALFMRANPDTCLSFARIRDFLQDCGTLLKQDATARQFDIAPEKLADMLAMELRNNAPTTRDAHAPVAGAQIVRRPTGQYLNRTHRQLLTKLGRLVEPVDSSKPEYMLDIEYPR